MQTIATIPTKPFTILMNGKDMGTIYANDLAKFMQKNFPGIAYTIRPDETTVDVAATLYELLEIREHRSNAYVIHD